MCFHKHTLAIKHFGGVIMICFTAFLVVIYLFTIKISMEFTNRFLDLLYFYATEDPASLRQNISE